MTINYRDVEDFAYSRDDYVYSEYIYDSDKYLRSVYANSDGYLKNFGDVSKEDSEHGSDA